MKLISQKKARNELIARSANLFKPSYKRKKQKKSVTKEIESRATHSASFDDKIQRIGET